MKIEFTHYEPFCPDAEGATYYVKVDGVEYKVERWHTSHTSGEEWYDAASGEGVASPFTSAEEDGEFEDAIAAFDAAIYQEELRVGLERLQQVALRSALARVNGGAPIDLPDLNNLDAVDAWLNAEKS